SSQSVNRKIASNTAQTLISQEKRDFMVNSGIGGSGGGTSTHHQLGHHGYWYVGLATKAEEINTADAEFTASDYEVKL
ncbi:hypothetical protein, partial [Azospirillum sp. TSH7]